MIGTGSPRLGNTRRPAARFARVARLKGRLGAVRWRDARRPGVLSRLWLLACCLLLTALPFATDPGKIISDTKFELAVNPSGFLSSALTLWQPQQFGGLGNQAYGYLFPMGPFFELGKLASVDGWVVQRLWIAALLLTAFSGTAMLARRMRIGSPWTQVSAGLVYAMSPAGLSIVGQLSGEFLPMAMLPWILLPLTRMGPWADGARASARARAAARSAVAVAFCSGMNAASTAAVCLPAVIYILTRTGSRGTAGTGAGRVRVRMLAWWLPAVLLATCSWLVPLVLMGRYGVSTVPYTESAQVTSTTTSLLNIFRGTENWVSYLTVNGLVWRPLALQLAVDLAPAFLIGVLAALGVAGLTRRDLPERRFLLWSVLSGVVIISLCYVSVFGQPLEGPLVGLINGPASPFRNLWKFAPLVGLPLALALAHLLATAHLPAIPKLPAPKLAPRKLRAALAVTAAVALAGVAVPAFATGLASGGAFAQVPSYWVSAADWLSAHAGNQAVLVEPGSAFGQYTWGSPMDDVLQSLTNVDYAERDLSTVGSVGNERLLNAIDEDLAAGDGSAGLAQVLAQMGVKYVLVRNDLSRETLNGAWPARISDALAESPGITPVAHFGPLVSGLTSDDAATSFDAPYPAVQIYQVAGAEPAAVVQPADGTLRVYGAPESLITLANAGLLGDRPVLLNNDGTGQPTAGDVDTDSLRKRAVNFGELRTDYSPTLTAGQSADTFLSTADYTDPGWSSYEAVARYEGIKNVTASSSASSLQAIPSQWATGAMPFSAVDGTLSTMWESGSLSGAVGQWLQVDLNSRARLSTIRVAFADNSAIGPPVTKVTVSTAAGEVSDTVRATGSLQVLRVPAGPTDWLRITIDGVAYQPATVTGTQAGIAGIVIPGIHPSETIVAPSAPGGDPSAVVLSKAQPQPSGCMLTSLRWVCSPELSTTTEEEYGFNHTFTEKNSERAVVTGSAILTDSSLADRYASGLDRDQPVVTASSTYTTDPEDQARSAFDGDTATAWIASPDDTHPKLTISWGYARTVSKLTIERPPGASGTMQVLISGSDGQVRGAALGADGTVTFAPMKTTKLTFTFTPIQAPVQVSEVEIPGVAPVSAPSGTFKLPCGYGPQLSINGRAVATKVTGTYADLLTGRPLEFEACSPVTLAAGSNQVTEPAADTFSVQDAVLTGDSAGTAASSGAAVSGAASTAASAPVAATVESWTSSSRELRVTAKSRSYLVVNENFNSGWEATADGRRLQAVQLDGWKQAWVLPAGTSGLVRLTYQPASVFRGSLIGGLGVLALIMLFAIGLGPVRYLSRRRCRASSRYPQEPWPQEARLPESRPPRRLLRLGVAYVLLAATGLLLAGYPGAVVTPASAAVFAILTRRWPWLPRSLVVVGLLTVASASGASGEHLLVSGDSGWVVTALASAVPEAICLIVVGALAELLIGGERPRERGPHETETRYNYVPLMARHLMRKLHHGKAG